MSTPPPYGAGGYDSDEADAVTAAGAYPCKIDGCQNTTTARMGPYAYLCDDHRAERAARHAAKQKRRARNVFVEAERNGRTDAATAADLRRALALTEQLEQLQVELAEVKQRLAKDWSR